MSARISKQKAADLARETIRTGRALEAVKTPSLERIRRAANQPTDEQLAAIAATARRDGDVFTVDSADGTKSYVVTPYSCSCGDWINRKSYLGEPCKHMEAISLLCPVPKPKPFVGDAFAGF